MARKRRIPTQDEFQTRFLRVLGSYYRANQVVVRILGDAALRDLSSALLWHCVNDTRARLAAISKDVRKRSKKELEKAVQSIPAWVFVYTRIDAKPHLAEYFTTLRADLLEKQRMLNEAPPSLDYGRGSLDWQIVGYVEQHLSAALGQSVSNATLAELLSAAFQASDSPTEITEDGVRRGLERYSARQFERQRPWLWKLLSERFPTGDKFIE